MTGKPFFISFEGGEGAGKSTQIALLMERIEREGYRVRVTREPGGTPEAEALRQFLVTGETGRWHPMSEALLIAAARVEHVEKLIKPQLKAGVSVLCDRFFDSSIAYQGAGLGLGMRHIHDLQRLAIGDFKPDLTLILDLPAEIGLARAKRREMAASQGEDRYERMGRDFHERLRRAYLEIAALEPARCKIIDANCTIEQASEAIWQVAQHFLENRR